jgi:hypothetical protein
MGLHKHMQTRIDTHADTLTYTRPRLETRRLATTSARPDAGRSLPQMRVVAAKCIVVRAPKTSTSCTHACAAVPAHTHANAHSNKHTTAARHLSMSCRMRYPNAHARGCRQVPIGTRVSHNQQHALRHARAATGAHAHAYAHFGKQRHKDTAPRHLSTPSSKRYPTTHACGGRQVPGGTCHPKQQHALMHAHATTRAPHACTRSYV